MSLKSRGVLANWTPPALKRAAFRLLHGRRDREIKVGDTVLSLPWDHALPEIRARWPLYDEPLRHVAEELHALRPGFRAIDIGANVGDSAAAIRAVGPVPVLCVEGDPEYLGYLDRNARAMGEGVAVERCFVGTEQGAIPVHSLGRHAGTTSAAGALREGEEGQGVAVRRLEEVLERHPSFDGAELLKLDTDGYDFDTISAHAAYLERTRPVLFFEYLVKSEEDAGRSDICLDHLTRIGFTRFLIFDNFGNRMMTAAGAAVFRELNQYLLSNSAFGGAVDYLDVCGATSEHERVLDRVADKTTQLVSTQLKGALRPSSRG